MVEDTSQSMLKHLLPDTWYKTLVYLSLVLILASFTVPILWLTNKTVGVISSGLFLFGLGEWKSWGWASWIKEANYLTGGPALMRAQVQNRGILSLVMQVLGIGIIIFALLSHLKII